MSTSILRFFCCLMFLSMASQYVYAQRDSLVKYYENGVIASKYVINASDDTVHFYTYYKSGSVFLHAFHDANRTLYDHVRYEENGDTIELSILPKIRSLPKINPDTIDWQMLPNGIGIHYVDDENVGVAPFVGATLMIEYQGWLGDGTCFDNSYFTRKPIFTELGKKELTPGLEQILPLLISHRRTFVRVPPEMAYGKKSFANIPPNSTLIYLLELVDFE